MRKLGLTRRSIADRFLAIAFALGAAVAPAGAQAPGARYSPRLGIYYDFEPYGGAYAVRLVAPPVPGSPLAQDQIQLEEGDRITELDGNAISRPSELENHFGRTSVAFVDVRAGQPDTRLVYLPPMTAPGVPRPGAPPRPAGVVYTGRYSPRLGIYYKLERAGGTTVARLTAPPVPGSPLAQDQIQLEEGDRITRLDGTAISGPNELERHFGQTSVTFIDVHTGRHDTRWVYLPPLTALGVPNPVGEAPPGGPPGRPDPVEETLTLPGISEVPPEIPVLFPLTTPSPRNP
jgi:hypothetical protein